MSDAPKKLYIKTYGCQMNVYDSERIVEALKPGGRFHIAVKTGTGEERDNLGRFYTYYTEQELTGLLEDAGLTVIDRREGCDRGLSGKKEPWIALVAHA